MGKRLNEIKLIIKEQENAGHRINNLNSIDMKWLIEQAETLQKIADTWVEIESDGTSEDADNFYTIVQDNLSAIQD